YLTLRDRRPVLWTWYQEGLANPADPSRSSFVTHHNAPGFFGYVVQNSVMNRHEADLTQFFDDVKNETLPDSGVFFVKGGFTNIRNLKPANTDPLVQAHFLGDDD